MNVKVNDKLITSAKILSPLSGGVLPINFQTEAEANTVEQELRDGSAILTVDVND